jgi:hypothetical protein
MQSDATTVAEYLASLPADRRKAIAAVRNVILRNLDTDYVEGMQYGMIGYAVSHRVFPAGYHCDPKQPLPFAALASQKNYMSIHLMGFYTESGNEDSNWFRDAWEAAGKKLDMGKCCVRFKKLEDVALDVLGEAIRRMPAKRYVELYAQALAQMGRSSGGSKATNVGAKRTATPAARRAPTAKKPAKKPARTAAKKR